MDWLKLFVCLMQAIGAIIAFCFVVFLCVMAVRYWGDAGALAATGVIIAALITVALYSEI